MINEIINHNNGNNPFEVFNYKNLGSVRTSVKDDLTAWFCLTDVADILDIKNNRDLIKRLERDGVDSIYTIDKIGRRQELLFVNESNLYRIIFTSRKPEAQDFQNWIFNEVIPSIRRTGSYSLENDTSLSLQTRVLINHERQILGVKKEVSELRELEATHYKELSERADIAQHRQELIIEEGYHTVFQYSHFMGVDTNTIDTNHLGRVASKICREMGIPTGKYPDGKYMINTYPYKILNKVFNELVFTTQNSN